MTTTRSLPEKVKLEVCKLLESGADTEEIKAKVPSVSPKQYKAIYQWYKLRDVPVPKALQSVSAYQKQPVTYSADKGIILSKPTLEDVPGLINDLVDEQLKESTTGEMVTRTHKASTFDVKYNAKKREIILKLLEPVEVERKGKVKKS
jgi:hypothetical protein